MALLVNQTDSTATLTNHAADHVNTNTVVNAITAGGSWTLLSGPSAESSAITTEADAITVGSLSIPIATEILITGIGRCVTSGANPQIGLKVNSTTTCTAASTPFGATTRGANTCFNFEIYVPARETSYFSTGWIQMSVASTVGNQLVGAALTADFPNATITSIAIRAAIAGAGGNGFIKNVRIYTR